MTIAWVFPGQGSQKLGMANSLQDLPGSRERFELASQILGRDLWKICSGEVAPNEEIYDLNDTRNTQPALFVVESLLVDDLKRQGRETNMIAGHSLGEIVGLYSADVLDAKTALILLKKRSELMAAARRAERNINIDQSLFDSATFEFARMKMEKKNGLG